MSVHLRPSSAAKLLWHLECKKLVSPREILVEPLDTVSETDMLGISNLIRIGFGFPAEETYFPRHWEENCKKWVSPINKLEYTGIIWKTEDNESALHCGHAGLVFLADKNLFLP